MNYVLTHIPIRPEKPRNKGVTMVMDKGLSSSQARDLVETAGDYIDFIKLGFGTGLLTPNTQDKIKIYQKSKIKPYFGGTLFEAFIVRGMFDDYRRMIEKFKVELVEVSDGCINIPTEEKLNFIHELSKDYVVLSEVGSKDSDIHLDKDTWIKKMKEELEAGAWKVIAEARESGNVGIYQNNGKAEDLLIKEIVNSVSNDKVIWEAPQKSQAVWFIKLLGSDVNLGNIASNEVIALETLRLGLRGDTFLDFLPQEITEKYKQINK